MSQVQPIRLTDYQKPDFTIEKVDLEIELDPTKTAVRSTLEIRRQNDRAEHLTLDGEALELNAVFIDGVPLEADRYSVDDQHLTVRHVPASFTLTVENTINPAENTALMGLYISSGMYCTQCEAEGFRRITWYLDRPDVLATFNVKLIANSDDCPVLLSNGNPVDRGTLDDGRHFATWHDPHPKPAYLFALVAGDLARIEDQFETQSGRNVDLHIYAKAKNLDQCHFAMDALKRSMRWDEEIYNLEYDLDLFQIVAVDDFNMGAMENKGLNIFNAAAILVRPDIATDQDFMTVERIIAHEYFHNWTGNRVTCRDWFQLTLKEGLTVFRDQQFSSDMHSPAVKRIGDVMLLREGQFAEDAGPLAHPIRPNSYLEINNFYTRTVYEKGAEVIRMLYAIIGRDAFYDGIKLYFERHDGSAATCEDFVDAMADASGENLDQFMRWYGRAGTPTLDVSRHFDADKRRLTLDIEQCFPPIDGKIPDEPLHMPFRVGLLSQHGAPMNLRLEGENEGTSTSKTLQLNEMKQRFTFEDVDEATIPSLLRGFTAPVRLRCDFQITELQTLMAHDEDAFVRWSAAQKLYLDAMLRRVSDPDCDNGDLEGIARSGSAILENLDMDPALAASLITMPSANVVGQELDLIDVDSVARARTAVINYMCRAWAEPMMARWKALNAREEGKIDTAGIAGRSLKNRCLTLLLQAGEAVDEATHQYRDSTTMTDRFAALGGVARHGPAQLASDLLDDFYNIYQRENLVINKWFALQASIDDAQAIERVNELITHPAFNFSNPNRVRSVFGMFAGQCFEGFHRSDGAGYRLIADNARDLDEKNPQVASRLLTPLGRWRRYDETRRDLMRGELEKLAAKPGLSRDSMEIVQRSLG